MRYLEYALLSSLAAGAAACAPQEAAPTPLAFTPQYEAASGRAQLALSRPLQAGETLYMGVRRGAFGTLDCTQAQTLTQVTEIIDTQAYGPAVPPSLLKPFYGPEWGGEPTPAMIAAAAKGTDSIIDICLMQEGRVVAQREADLFQVWDNTNAKRRSKPSSLEKADDPAPPVEPRLNSALEYGEKCVTELGEIPFFPKLADGSYETYDCLNSTPIPMTVTAADGTITHPDSVVDKCDNPQYIYSLCEPGPRVATKINEAGTRWTLLCRKSIGGYASNQYNDIAMIGHNPYTGKTCFFQNALYQKKDGAHIPHPADREKSNTLWSGVHGGMGNGGIECARCHDSDAFIHSPWIDGAKDAQGHYVVPRMGDDPDLPIGANDAPYSLVNLVGQGWTMPKQIVSPEANECLRCHRMANGRWADSWLDRLDGESRSWQAITTDAYLTPKHAYWMPPDQAYHSREQWQASGAHKAIQFIIKCNRSPEDPSCLWKDLPTESDSGPTGGNLRNPVDLPDEELANQASALLGMNREARSQICSDCHTPSERTLRDWQRKSVDALGTCLRTDEVTRKTLTFDRTLATDEFVVLGEVETASGTAVRITMTGDGDADLLVKRNGVVTKDDYDCRPYAGDSNEVCDGGSGSFVATGPAKFSIGVNGFTAATVKIEVEYFEGTGATRAPEQMIQCMRMNDEATSPFAPAKLGIFAAGAHLGWFQDVFRTAFADGSPAGNARFVQEYSRFKARTGMPKGNHPRFDQAQFDIVAEWFMRGLPYLYEVLPPNLGPTECVPFLSDDLISHARRMATQGWAAQNRDAGMNMFGCQNAATPKECLATFPRAVDKPYAATWEPEGSTIRILRELTFNTYFWTRSSPDGRFVANGATAEGSRISDLLADKDIVVDASYDPGFFPNGGGWIFQGTPAGTSYCSNDLLMSTPESISFAEPQCSAVDNIRLYQHLGVGLGGGDYVTINSQFVSDNPSPNDVSAPVAGFSDNSDITLTPMTYDGTRYIAKPQISVATPFEGDSVLSPSTTLMVSRFGANAQIGYTVRRVVLDTSGPTITAQVPEVARFCEMGGKPAISFDERWMVWHRYEATGNANIYVMDLTTGVTKQVTNVGAKQLALFPHFRSDGWLYFIVRDLDTNLEYVAASDVVVSAS